MQKMSGENVKFKKMSKSARIAAQFLRNTFCFQPPSRILMSASIFRPTIFNPRLFLSSEPIRNLQEVSARYYTSFMCNPRVQLKFSFRKRIQESKYCSARKITCKHLVSIDENKFCC